MSGLYSILKKERFLKDVIKSLEADNLLKENWQNIFGDLAKDMSFGYFKEGILAVDVSNYLWVTEIDYFKKQIIVKANEYLRKKVRVLDLKVSYQKKKKSNLKLFKNNKTKNLEEAIKQDIEQKLKDGYKFCKTCNAVLVYGKNECFFCVNKQAQDHRLNVNDNSVAER